VALYHLAARTGTRAGGQSALAKAQYIQREDRYARVPDAVAYATSGNLPSFAGGSATAYWEAADAYERANGRLFKEVEFALPIELGTAEHRALAESFVEELLAGEKLPYTLAIHEGHGQNPHCHVLVSERVNDEVERDAWQWFRRWNAREPELGGARKSEALKPREWLECIREKWAELVNRALERAGFLERVDHRSLEAQGIDRVPQIHLGPNVVRMEERGLRTDRADQMLRIEERNVELGRLRARLAEIERAKEIEGRGREGTDPGGARGSSGDHGTQVAGNQPGGRGDGAEPRRGGGALPRPEPAGDSGSAGAGARDRELAGAPAATGRSPGRHGAEPARGEPESLDRRDRLHTGGPGRDRNRAEDDSETVAGGSTASTSGSERRGALADPEREGTAPGREDHGLDAPDRTARAVERQLRAMGCRLFEIGIREASTGRMMNRTWSMEQTLDNLTALKRMNARGNDVFVRPAERTGHGLVLLDDLKPSALARMERDGRGPAAVVETSRGNFQAWVRVPSRAPGAERGEIARRLAHEYGADRASASSHHYGRLAGFTNQKESHRSREGLQPFALLRGASGRSAPDGELLLRQAERALRERSRARSRGLGREAPTRTPTKAIEQEAAQLYQRRFAELRRGIGDLSRCDFGASLHLVRRGYDRDTIERAMRATSPEIEERKRGHVRDYVSRTVEAAARVHDREREAVERTLGEFGVPRRPHTRETQRDATRSCRRHLERSSDIADPTRRDLAAAIQLGAEGYSARTIEYALRAASPDLEERTRGQAARHVRAVTHVALDALARRLEREREPDRGMER
jgi:hypothetical protein